MGLLSSPLVKILGGHGVICYYCFLFFCVCVSNHPSELETGLDLAEVRSGAPRRSPQGLLTFLLHRTQREKNKTLPSRLFHLLFSPRSAPALGVPEEMQEQEPRQCEEGTSSPGTHWVCQCLPRASSTHRKVVIPKKKKKSSFESQLLRFRFFTTVFYLLTYFWHVL